MSDEVRIDAMAEALGLVLSEESRAGVAANLAVLARMAALVEAVPLDPHDDPLPLYRP